MFKIIVLTLFCLGFMTLTAHAQEPKKPAIIILEKSFETEKLRIKMTDDLNGKVVGRTCSHCEEMTVTITPETKAYDHKKPVPLIEAKKRVGKTALVVFDVNTKKVTRISWPL